MFEVQNRNAKSARWWFNQRDQIDMEPEYQRLGGIWKRSDQQFLIDSIINDYDIPKLYVADFSTLKSDLNRAKRKYAVVDGKQRLETLFSFFGNKLPLSTSISYLPDRSIKIGGMYYKDLVSQHPEIAAKVEEFPLPVMHIVTDEVERINELFVRLNKGAALTGAEKRNAMIGPIPGMVREIAGHRFFAEFVRYTAQRGQNLNAAAKILLFEISEDFPDTKKTNLDRMVEDFEVIEQEDREKILRRVRVALNRMCDVFGVKDELFSSQGSVPVYYWLVRTARKADLPALRSFLVEFNHALKSNRANEQDERDSLLTRYDEALRSVNDAWSHERRFNILSLTFEAYLHYRNDISRALARVRSIPVSR